MFLHYTQTKHCSQLSWSNTHSYTNNLLACVSGRLMKQSTLHCRVSRASSLPSGGSYVPYNTFPHGKQLLFRKVQYIKIVLYAAQFYTLGSQLQVSASRGVAVFTLPSVQLRIIIQYAGYLVLCGNSLHYFDKSFHHISNKNNNN